MSSLEGLKGLYSKLSNDEKVAFLNEPFLSG